jgi:hypothetical protein
MRKKDIDRQGKEKKTAKSKNTIMLVAVLSSLAAELIYTSLSISFAFADEPGGCFMGTIRCHDRFCTNDPDHLQATCCWYGPAGQRQCQTCDVNLQTGDFENCNTYSRNAGSGNAAAPPTNVAPPALCPDGSSPDANGKCPPVTQGPSQSNDQGTTQFPPPPPKHHKGSNDLPQLPLTKQKDSVGLPPINQQGGTEPQG